MRCIVCNTPLKPEEIVFNEETKEHETHCGKCLHQHAYEDFDSTPMWDEGSPNE